MLWAMFTAAWLVIFIAGFVWYKVFRYLIKRAGGTLNFGDGNIYYFNKRGAICSAKAFYNAASDNVESNKETEK